MAQMLVRVNKEMDEALKVIEQVEAPIEEVQKSYEVIVHGVYKQWKKIEDK